MLMQIADSPVDWPSLYADIETRGDIPYASSQTIDAVHATFQGMYLDLAEIKQALTASGMNPPLVTVHADVLNIPEDTTWLAQDILLLYARRIQAGAGNTINLDYRTEQLASLVVYCTELEGTIRVVATQQDGAAHPMVFPISVPSPTGGVQIRSVDGDPTQLSRTWAQGMASPPTDIFEQALITEFIFASLLYDEHPDIALGQLAWIKNWAGQATELQGLLFRSASLLALLRSQLDARANGAAFVPYLSAKVYTDLAAPFVAQATQYETDLRQLTTQKVVTDDFISLAKTLLDNQTYQSEYAARVQDQAKSNYDNAAAAVAQAQAQFEQAQTAADLAAIDFKDKGIPEWEREKIEEAIIKLGTALITFGVGIAAMFVGDEAAGAASAGAAVEGAEAVAQAAKVGSEIAKLAQQLADVMKQLKKIGEGLKQVYELSKVVVESAGDFANAQDYAKKLERMDLSTDGTDLTATYGWQVYQLNADATLQGPISQGVGYATELKVAVDVVAIYGQALAAAQVAAIQAGQAYAQAAWQHELSVRQQQRLAEEVASLQVGEQPIVSMMQQFYMRYVDAKSSLFAAIEGYRAAYFYWALAQSSIRPSIIDEVGELDSGLESLTAIALDQANALEHFSPPPQVLTSKRIVVDDPAVLGTLRASGTAGWDVGVGAMTFDGFDRVRLSRVRIWLEGAKPGTAGQVNIMISTLGSYQDRFQGTSYQFTSQPLQRDFEYRVSAQRDGTPDWRFDNGTYGYIEVDGVVDHEVSYAYFEPTPFAQWRIDLTAHNPGVDLSGVTKITMEFAGSVIAETSAAAARLANS